jgi:ATP-binding cassette subfamily C protein CydD
VRGGRPPSPERRLLDAAPSARAGLVLSVAASLLAAGAVVGQAAALSRAIAGAAFEGRTAAEVAPALAAVVGLAGVRAALLWLADGAAHRAAAAVQAAVRDRFVGRLLALGPGFTRTERTGELATSAVEGVEALDDYVRLYLPLRALAVLVPALVLVAELVADPLSAAAILVVAPFVPLLAALIGLRTRDLVNRRWAELARLGAHFLDVLQGLATLKLFGQSRDQGRAIARMAERYGTSTMDVLRVAFQATLVMDLAATMGVALVATEVGGRLLLRGLPFDRALFVLLLAPEFFLPIRQFAAARHARLAAAAAAERLLAVIDAPGPARQPGPRASAAPPPDRFDVRFEAVAYTPPERTEAALAGVTFELPAGLTTALVGPSGAGKSTVVDLLLRLSEPSAGRVTVGGTPLAALDPAAWRRLVAWVPQHPHLFHGSVADNIRLARPDAALDEVVAAARAAGADEFVVRLPRGYETPVGEDGARLSGGQRQRIALARALLRPAPLVVLDEPTAHLDPEREGPVRSAVADLCRGRTALVVSHRLDLVAAADRVVVLDRGRVVECGPPDALLAAGGAYARLAAAAGAAP